MHLKQSINKTVSYICTVESVAYLFLLSVLSWIIWREPLLSYDKLSLIYGYDDSIKLWDLFFKPMALAHYEFILCGIISVSSIFITMPMIYRKMGHSWASVFFIAMMIIAILTIKSGYMMMNILSISYFIGIMNFVLSMILFTSRTPSYDKMVLANILMIIMVFISPNIAILSISVFCIIALYKMIKQDSPFLYIGSVLCMICLLMTGLSVMLFHGIFNTDYFLSLYLYLPSLFIIGGFLLYFISEKIFQNISVSQHPYISGMVMSAVIFTVSIFCGHYDYNIL